MASIFCHDILSYLKNLNKHQFSKQIKLYLLSEQLENSMRQLSFEHLFHSFEYPLLIWCSLSPYFCILFTHLFKSFNFVVFFCT